MSSVTEFPSNCNDDILSMKTGKQLSDFLKFYLYQEC
jgi:hypothetical protein